jgi:hypothetical protein
MSTVRERERESYFMTRFTASQFILVSSPLRRMTSIFFQLNTFSYSPSVIYSCCWASPGRSFLGPSPTGLMTIFCCLRFETPPTYRAGSPYLYPPGTGWPSYTPRHWVPFSSPPGTQRAMVEVIEPASTQGWTVDFACPYYITLVQST